MSKQTDYKEEMARFGELLPGVYDTTGVILHRVMDLKWEKMPAEYNVSKADLKLLNELSTLPLDFEKKFELIHSKNVFVLICRIFSKAEASGDSDVSDMISWLMVLLHEMLREDSFRHERLLETVEDHTIVHSAFLHLLKRQTTPHLADRAVALATGFVAHDGNYRSSTEVEELTILMIDRQTKCTNAGVLAAIGNLLKVTKFRPHLWNISGVHVLIRASLSPTKSDPVSQYQAAFCTWLLSFSPKFVPHLVESGILLKTLQLLRQTPRKEKIVRLAVEIVANSLECLDAIQVMLDEKLADVLDLLLFEKWRSEDLYKRIEQVCSVYAKMVKEWSTFDRFMKELDTGKLSHGYLHEEQFWADNVMQFEGDEFLPIRKLITLLRSNDATTLSLACHDLGEFARLHPVGKQILAKYRAREMLLTLMDHEDRAVERESLLCIQKLMLDNWEVVAK